MEQTEAQTRLGQLERIVDAWQDYLFRFAYMRTGVREEAEDIVQDVLLRLFRSEEALEHVSDLKFYLLRSISNRCRDWHRRHRISKVSLDAAAGLCIQEEDRDIREEYLRVKRLLDLLPERQAEVIRLKCNDGLTFTEIACLTGVSESTVKSRYRYGIRHINEQLEREGNGE